MLRLCDGTTSRRHAAVALGLSIDEVAAAVARLQTAGLLGDTAAGTGANAGGAAQAAVPAVTRRAALAGAAALGLAAVPGVVTVLLPTAAAAASVVPPVVVPRAAYGWGFNGRGDVGDGTTTNRSTPTLVALPVGVTLTGVTTGAAADHSLGNGSDGHTYAWGGNIDGQLGDGTTTTRSAPVTVRLPAGVTLSAAAAGGSHSLGVGSDGHTYAWGSNSSGQLGDGTGSDSTLPTRVALPAGVTLTTVGAGFSHSLGLTGAGAAYAWGRNADGRLGDGTTADRATPVKVAVPVGVTLTALVAGGVFSLALAADGSAYTWGDNTAGELGDGTTAKSATPVKVTAPAGGTFTRVAAGYEHCLALGSDGNTYAWGYNSNGQLGNGTASTAANPVPVKVAAPAGVTFSDIAGGGEHSLALGSDGGTYAWGYNYYGQLGDGTTTQHTTPTRVTQPVLVTFQQIAAGGGHSLGL